MLKNFLEKCADIILSVPHNKEVVKQLRVGGPLLHLLAQTPGDQKIKNIKKNKKKHLEIKSLKESENWPGVRLGAGPATTWK